jgi:hypothetical protein
MEADGSYLPWIMRAGYWDGEDRHPGKSAGVKRNGRLTIQLW